MANYAYKDFREFYYLLVPDLEWLAANAVQDGQEPGLKRVLEHLRRSSFLSSGSQSLDFYGNHPL